MSRKNQYPRPQFVRSQWENLNGSWEFAFDDADRGISEKWYEPGKHLNREIQVPFVYQCELSGINDQAPHDIVWYKKRFSVEKQEEGKELLLHFEAVDYEAVVYVNGQQAGKHTGGYTPFSVNMTPYLAEGEQEVTVRVWDSHTDELIPRGKQFWDGESRSIWYTNSTGIWQSVWMEWVPEKRLEHVRFTSLYDQGKIQMQCEGAGICEGDSLYYKIRLKDKVLAEGTQVWLRDTLDFSVDIINGRIFNTNYHEPGISWTPENPVLLEVELEVRKSDGQCTDRVQSYFGFRKVHTEHGMVYLNNRPYYQKLVLDQGYWPQGLLTAPDDEALVKDIELAKAMGFNGCRKHQKVEEARFLYWADKLGFLVWGECAAPTMYDRKSVNRTLKDWSEIVERDYNHPCIVTWVPINESWGVPGIQRNKMQQSFSETMYHYLHAVDDTRLVVSNDGWNMTVTDICAIHNYSHGQKEETEKYEEYKETLSTKENLIGQPPSCWDIYAKGYSHQGEPILLTEFGGIGFEVSKQKGWGYSSVNSEKEFLEDYRRIMDAVYASEGLWGYCYTQLTDVEQEINGLVTYDRKPKCDLAEIKKINDGYHKNRIGL